MSNRASDADRSEVTDILRESAAEGRLNIDELSDRIHEAMNSKTYADLHRCLRELPQYDNYKPWQKQNDFYNPWQKINREDIEVVGHTSPARSRRLKIAVPVLVGLVVLVLMSSLTGVIAGILLLPFKLIFYIALVTVVIRVFRFFARRK